MKLIVRIALLELKSLFYSPVAWLVFIIFTLQTGFEFLERVEWLEGYQTRGSGLGNYTQNIFSSRSKSLFLSVKNNLYLFIPMLTMGLISKELSNGSIKLLLSSPVTFTQIVLGKYFSMIVCSLFFCAILGIFMFAGSLLIPNFDYSLVLSGIAGLFLLIGAYAAIGLFISGLTSYQVVAAIGTFAIIALFGFIDNLWQEVPVVNDIMYWLSIPARVDQMISGLVSSQGVIYFLVVIALFVTLTIVRLNNSKSEKGMSVKVLTYVLPLLLAICLGYISSRPYWIFYVDNTANQRETLTTESQKVVRQLKNHPLKVTSFVNILSKNAGRSGLPKHHNYDYRKFEKYTRFLPQLQLEYVYFYDTIPSNPGIYKKNPGLTHEQLARKIATSFNLDFNKVLKPSEIRQLVDLTAEGNQYVRQLAYQEKKTFLRMYDDIAHYPHQEITSSALKQLTMQAPRVGFVTGHGERQFSKKDEDYYLALMAREDNRFSLLNRGFFFSTINLDQSLASIDILVLADPKKNLTRGELIRLEKFIQAGGNMLIMGEPENSEYLRPVLSMLGVTMINGALQQESKDFAPDFILSKTHDKALNLSSRIGYKKMFEMGLPIAMPGVSVLKFNSHNGLIVSVLSKVDEERPVHANDTLIAMDKPVATSISLERNINDKKQRIIVTGDADFMSNAEFSRSTIATFNGRGFVTGLFEWLAYGEFPVNYNYPEGKDDLLQVDKAGVRVLNFLFLGVLPGILLVAGASILFLRRRN